MSNASYSSPIVAGAQGPTGAAGAVWRSGAGAPDNGVGVNGDLYLRTSNGDVYQRAAGVYAVIENIIGPIGATGDAGTNGADGANGTDGADGTVWRDGFGVPDNGLGVDGDYYLDTEYADVYHKVAGTYEYLVTIMGPQGPAGAAGGVARIGCSVYRSQTVSIPSAVTDLVLNVDDWDSHDFHAKPSAEVIIPVGQAGVFDLNFEWYQEDPDTATWISALLFIDTGSGYPGTPNATAVSTITAGGGVSVHLSRSVALVAGNKVKIATRHDGLQAFDLFIGDTHARANLFQVQKRSA